MKNIKLPFFAAILTLGLLNSCGTDGCTDPTASNYNSDALKMMVLVNLLLQNTNYPVL